MSFENPERRAIRIELAGIRDLIESIEAGDQNVAYADTSDSMDSLDALLGENEWYQESLVKRRSASQKIMGGDKSGLQDILAWIREVESKL